MRERERLFGREWLKDYRQGPDGKYIYTGKYYVLPLDGRQFVKMLVLYFLLVVAQAGVFVWTGYLPTQSMNTFYVLIPFTVTLLPILLSGWCCIDIAISKKKLARHYYETSVERLKNSTLCAAVLGGIAALCQAGYLIFQAPGVIAQDILFIVGCVFFSALSTVFYFLQKKFVWQLEE